jgi:hypothetical protein
VRRLICGGAHSLPWPFEIRPSGNLVASNRNHAPGAYQPKCDMLVGFSLLCSGLAIYLQSGSTHWGLGQVEISRAIHDKLAVQLHFCVPRRVQTADVCGSVIMHVARPGIAD